MVFFCSLVLNLYSWIAFFPSAANLCILMSSSPCLCLQDEYSIFPQTYSIDINGYILVYSVTSNKRSASKTQMKFCLIFRAIAQVPTAKKKKNELCPRFFPALKSYKLSMKNCWTWWEKSSKYLFSRPGKTLGIYHTWMTKCCLPSGAEYQLCWLGTRTTYIWSGMFFHVFK